MVDVPVTPPVSPPAVLPAAPTATVAPIEATVTSVPDKIQELIRQIQVNATVTQLPGDGTAILNSIIGPLTVLLPQLADAQQQKLIQQFLSLIQTQRPLTVVVQPGSPPTQAFLFLPPPTNVNPTTQPAPINPIDNILNQAINLPRIPITPGATLPAIVLPPNLALPTAAQSQPAPVYVPPSTFPTTPPELNPALTPAAAAISALANELAPELVNTPAFQELVAKAEITVSQPPQSPTPIAVTNVPPSSTTIAPTASPITLQNVPQSTSLLSNTVQPNLAPTTPAPTQTATTNLGQAGIPANAPAPTLTTTPQINTSPTPSLLTQTIPPALTSLLQAGNEVTLQVNAVIPPALPSALVSTAPNLPIPGANQILATVTSSGLNGQILLQAGDTAFYVKQPSDIAVGSTLLLTIEPAKTQALQTLPIPNAQNFTNLQAALSSLAQINPQLAQQVMENHIPQATMALPGALLFFMSALKQSNVRTWLGDDAVDALSRAGKFELLSKLSQDLAKAGQEASDPVVGEWKSYPVPFQSNNQFQIINFYVHGNAERQGGGSEESSLEAARRLHTRFLIDVRMSQLGPMQLDGFVQPKKLDIVVRSEHTLPEGLHNELRQVYIKALGGIDYAGSLNFQVGRHHWLIIQNAKGQAAITT